MKNAGKPRRITAETVPGKAIVSDYYRLLSEISDRDDAGAPCRRKCTAHGYLLDRIVGDIKGYVAQQL